MLPYPEAFYWIQNRIKERSTEIQTLTIVTIGNLAVDVT